MEYPPGESLFHTINQDPPSLLPFRLSEIRDCTRARRAGVPKSGDSLEPLGNYKIQIWEFLSRHTKSGPRNQSVLKLLPSIYSATFTRTLAVGNHRGQDWGYLNHDCLPLRCHCQEKCPLLHQVLENKLAVFWLWKL